jgi:two-component sensor histidine kinase
MFASAEIPGRAISPIALTLVDEINHRVINEYSEAIASLSIAASRTPEQDAKAALRRAADRLRDHAASHRALSPPVGGERANLADYIGEICIALTKAMLEERGVHLELKTVDAIIPGERCWQIGLIVAELIRNAARHGLRGQAGQISVHITGCSDNLTCLVEDTGRASATVSPGRGQRLVRALVADLGGSVQWSFRSDGSFALLQFPRLDVAQVGGLDKTGGLHEGPGEQK